MSHRTRCIRVGGGLLVMWLTFTASWLLTNGSALARGGGHSGGSASTGASHHSSRYCATCERDSQGRIQRSSSERRKFLESLGLTHTPPGMQVDHIVPLSKGGADKTWNMQLIPKDSAKGREG